MDGILQLLLDASPLQIGAFALSFASVGYICVKTVSSGPPTGLVYPPGPPRDPILGNMRNFPRDNLAEACNELQKSYGDIVFLQLPGIDMVNVNSLHMAHELLSKRASTTGGRKMGYMAHVMMGWGWSVVLRNADSAHLAMKRMLRRGIGLQRISSHDLLFEQSANQLLLSLRGVQGNSFSLIQATVGGLLVELTYGKEVWSTIGQDLVNLNVEVMDMINRTNNKLWLVDIFRPLRFIPSWMPGAEFRRRGERCTELTNQLRKWPFVRILELQRQGKLGHCLAADLVEEFGASEQVQDSLAVLYFGGVDTTSSAVLGFLLVMVLFPEVASKVKKEIEDVVGRDSLPKVTDRPNLPYTEAVWKESLRWGPVGPLGLPHMNTADEVIDGYFIRKGTIINANIGFMLNDPRIWGDPRVFRPERHLLSHNPSAASLPNPYLLSFGFGQRICPGMHLADRFGFHLVTTIMAVYDVLPLEGAPPLDPNAIQYTGNLIRVPKDFQCRFVPRNPSILNALGILGSS